MRNKKGCILSFLFLSFILGISIPLFMSTNRKIKAQAITDLTNTTWIIKDASDITTPSINETYYINFSDSNDDYTMFKIGRQDTKKAIWYDYSLVLYGGAWLDESYRTITISGGTDTTNTTLISWLETYATQQIAPQGTEITHKYWAFYLDIYMTDNEVVSDDNISYKVLWNEYTDDYNEQTLTGLAFTGVLSSDNHSYIISIDGSTISTLYQGNTNTIDNTIWLEFTTGDYMDTDLYNLMEDRGVWFDDASVYLAGTNLGSIYGFNRGVAYGEANATQYTSLVTTILNGLGNILNIQVFPNITIGLIIGLPLLLGVLVIVLKILRG